MKYDSYLYYRDRQFKHIQSDVNNKSYLKLMKEYFVATLKGRMFEIKRISTSNFGTWYSVSVILDEKEVKYSISNASGGLWKIITQRLPAVIYRFESELCELIEKNEKNEKQTGYQPRFGLTI